MERKQITGEEIIGEIDVSFDSVEKLRGEGLERIKLFHSVKNMALEKEHKRLSEKFGPEHPRVKKMATRIKYNQGLFKGLDVEIEKTKIHVPPLKANSWMVHGRILDKDKKGISGLTMSLYDEKENWMKKLGYGCTDNHGYFSIIYTLKEGTESEALESILRRLVYLFGLKKETESDAMESMKLFLYISDKNYKILYKDKEPIYVKIGQVVYREIYLSEDEICSAPEPGKGDTMITADP